MVAVPDQKFGTASTVRLVKVLSRLNADEPGIVARKDLLIRLYGKSYLRRHKREQLAIVCCNKLRENAQLLIEVRKGIKNSELQFFIIYLILNFMIK